VSICESVCKYLPVALTVNEKCRLANGKKENLGLVLTVIIFVSNSNNIIYLYKNSSKI